MVVAVFAVLKCGAAYVPMAPDLPEQRLRHISRRHRDAAAAGRRCGARRRAGQSRCCASAMRKPAALDAADAAVPPEPALDADAAGLRDLHLRLDRRAQGRRSFTHRNIVNLKVCFERDIAFSDERVTTIRAVHVRRRGRRDLRHLARRQHALHHPGRDPAGGRTHPIVPGRQRHHLRELSAGLLQSFRSCEGRQPAPHTHSGLAAEPGHHRQMAGPGDLYQRLRPDRDHRTVDCVDQRPAAHGRGVHLDRAADVQHARLCVGPAPEAGAARHAGRAVPGRRRRRHRLPEPARADEREVRRQPVPTARAHVSHRRPGAATSRWQLRVPRPARLPDQDQGPPRGTRGGGARAAQSPGGEGSGCGGPAGRGRQQLVCVLHAGRRARGRACAADAFEPDAARLHGAELLRRHGRDAVDEPLQDRPPGPARSVGGAGGAHALGAAAQRAGGGRVRAVARSARGGGHRAGRTTSSPSAATRSRRSRSSRGCASRAID